MLKIEVSIRRIVSYALFHARRRRYYVNNAAYTYSFPDVKDYQDFLGVIQASSEYDTGISVSEKDRVITLSTCVNTRKDYRYLVHGRLDQKISVEE